MIKDRKFRAPPGYDPAWAPGKQAPSAVMAAAMAALPKGGGAPPPPESGGGGKKKPGVLPVPVPLMGSTPLPEPDAFAPGMPGRPSPARQPRNPDQGEAVQAQPWLDPSLKAPPGFKL